MNQKSSMKMWDMMRQRNGIAIRAIERLPEDKLDSRPIRDMRTPKELVVHWYGMSLRAVLEGAARGRIEDLDEPSIVARIKTKAELLAYCKECWDVSTRAVGQLTDEKLAATVETPWGTSFPGTMCLGIALDESLHHRGQFYAYLRALGAEPPNMWDFKGNAPEFQPRADTAKV